MIERQFEIGPGTPTPFGVLIKGSKANFSIVCGYAEAMTLCLYVPSNLNIPVYEIPLVLKENRTGDVWHVSIQPIEVSWLYAWKIENTFNSILDPYAIGVYSFPYWGEGRENALEYSPKGLVDTSFKFDWEQDQHPKLSKEELVIYEMHLRGFTQDVSSHTYYSGTYLGVIEKIPHLLKLGVNAVEFLPIQEFNECEYRKKNPFSEEALVNYWGYSTVNFFTPMQRYAYDKDLLAPMREFKTMVRELHKAGIEVYLDVVFNHTAEGGKDGPVLSFKGLDPFNYYIMDKDKYLDFSGCGNTLKLNNPIVSELVLKSLQFWVTEMHVDGFRLDLASIFKRDDFGHPMKKPPILDRIFQDPILASTKFIAEPWDAVGLYQVGYFYLQSTIKCSEWNGQYRDIVRKFIRGEGEKGKFASSLSGSSELYQQGRPSNSINFITAHDGFTLRDLVSFNGKYNLENGENNRDGSDHNESWNCGFEGEIEDQEINDLRLRQRKNFHLALMVSRGIPMILMGDEYGHSKKGNNNTWCQDNRLNWFCWDELEKEKDFFRFYTKIIHFRKNHLLLKKDAFLTSNEIDWYDEQLQAPDWSKENQFLAYVLRDDVFHQDLYIAFNASQEDVLVQFPKCHTGMQWSWVVNTEKKSPEDFLEEEKLLSEEEASSFKMRSYSSIMLKAYPQILLE